MRNGILYASACYTLWGIFPLYFKSLKAIPPTEILLHRMIWSLMFLAMVLTWRKQWSWLKSVIKQPRVLAGFALSAILLSVNWLIYIWSINNNRIIDASLGYFMTPLVSVFLGSLYLKERLRILQWIAVLCAAIGVAWLTWHNGHLPWIGISLALSFGVYGLLRKTASLGPLEGLSLETMILFPFAFTYLMYLGFHDESAFVHVSTNTQLLLLAAGPITAIPLLLFAAGARRIPMATLGLLQYIAPSLQLLLGVWLYKENFPADRLLGFLSIWLGLLLYSIDGLRVTYRKTNNQKFL
jgi:chloramphenicol-sensitive protein RarD